MFLFARNGGGSVQNPMQGRMYYFRIWNNESLIKNLLPAQRISDGVIGMYDTVSNTFFTNSGTGNFIAGPELAIGKSGGYSLPIEYQQVEYLESTGKQYMGITKAIQANDIVKVNVSYISLTNNSQPTIFAGTQIQMYTNSSKQLSYWQSSNIEAISPAVYTVLSVNTKYSISAKIKASSDFFNLFSYNGTVASYAMIGRIEQVTITRNNANIINLYPCYRKSDMKPGMYDTVNKTFYTNSGSGEFILGPTVNSCYLCEPNAGFYCPYDNQIYTEPDGSKWIRIYHVNNPYDTANIFASTDQYTTQPIKKNEDTWCAFNLLNLLYGQWEMMVKSKTTSDATQKKYRWIQSSNPLTCSYSDVHNNITTIITSGYTAHPANAGGLFKSSSNIMLRYDNNTNGNDWWGLGAWTRYSNGYPGYGQQTITTGYQDAFLRIPDDDSGKFVNMSSIYDSNKGWVFSGENSTYSYLEFDNSLVNQRIAAKQYSISMWVRIHNNNRHILFGDGSNVYNISIEYSPTYHCFRYYFTASPDVMGTNTNIQLNTWYHIVISVTSTGFKSYVNGVLDYNYTSAPAFIQLTGQCRIGSDQRTTSIYAGSDITNFIFFAEALSADQVKELYGQ